MCIQTLPYGVTGAKQETSCILPKAVRPQYGLAKSGQGFKKTRTRLAIGSDLPGRGQHWVWSWLRISSNNNRDEKLYDLPKKVHHQAR
jgi:hypothetical protein